MKNIGTHLQNSGFKTELSFAIDSSGKKEEKFYKTLWQHLGEFRFGEYLKLQNSYGDPDGEVEMMKFIGKDESLFKLPLSAQLEISEEMFKEIISICKGLDFHPQSMLDLGGANF
jgi:hypothetical protein